jgi:hypothetical protein
MVCSKLLLVETTSVGSAIWGRLDIQSSLSLSSGTSVSWGERDVGSHHVSRLFGASVLYSWHGGPFDALCLNFWLRLVGKALGEGGDSGRVT